MIIHEEKDQFGTLMVNTADNLVDLLFKEDPNAVQSRINLSSPKIPELEYIRAMCLGASLSPAPRDILILGLGGGSLAKFYCENFPSAHIDIVDVRPSLWSVAKKFFQFLPSVNTRFHVEDAVNFVNRAADNKRSYDLILVDLYIDGPSNVMSSPALWMPISQILSPLGFCLSNVWRFNSYEILYEMLIQSFSRMFNTVARTDLQSNQCILTVSQLDPTVLDTPALVNRTDIDSVSSGIPLTDILRSTRILK